MLEFLRKRVVAPVWTLVSHMPGGARAWEWGLRWLDRPSDNQPSLASVAPPQIEEQPFVPFSEVVFKATIPQPTQPSRWCKVCDLPDWDNDEFGQMLDALDLSFGRQSQHRKHWEFVQGLRGLKHFGYLKPDAFALGVGSGREHPLYYLANRIHKVIASDIYGYGAFQAQDAMADMLVTPEKYAPFPYRECHLVTQYMNGLELRYPSDCFDFVFSFSSIEHFGGHDGATRAMQEMTRVLKPGGMAVIATEAILNGVPHPEFFLPDELYTYLVQPSGLRLMEDIDFSISRSLLEDPLDPSTDDGQRFPHIVCRQGAVAYTSVLLFLQKPMANLAVSH